MRFLAQLGLLLPALLIASCTGVSGGGLVPGVATEGEVEKAMGPSADRRQIFSAEDSLSAAPDHPGLTTQVTDHPVVVG